MIAKVQDDLIIVFILCMLVTYFAWRKKFYSFPVSTPGLSPFKLSYFYPLTASAIYFFGMLILGSFVFLTIKNTYLSKFALIWTHIITLLLLMGVFVLYLSQIKREVLAMIFTGKRQFVSIFDQFGKNIGLGIITWLISYPIVVFVNLILQKITWSFWQIKGVNQVAVELLKKTKANPSLFVLLSLVLIVIVPFLEELIFRGFLQTFIRQYLGRLTSLILSAFIFAVCHYATAQGIGNIELIGSLFVLAMYLGFLYERQRNLWASFGLHMTFNALSILSLLSGAN